MKFNLSTTLLLSALSCASSIEDEATGNQLARCFSDCEDIYRTSGSSVNDCRSRCRAGENWKKTGRAKDYKNARNRRSRRRSRRRDYDDYYGDVEDAESTSLQAMLKGMISPKDKQILVDLNKDNGGGGGGNGGGKSDGGGNKSDGGGNNKSDGGGNKSDGGNNNGKNNRSNDNDDKKNNNNKNKNDDDDKKRKNDDDDDKKGKNDDDDKKNKDDDDDKKRKNDDDDDDKKNKDDDDDDDDKNSRNINVPECVTGGKNYLRCDPATVKSSDKETCNAIKHEVCGKDMSNIDQSYCECIGLYEDASAQLQGAESTPFRAMLKGMISTKDKQVLVDLNKDNGGGGGGDGGGKSNGGGNNKSDGGGNNKSDGGGNKSDGGNDNGKDKKRKNDDDDDDKKNKDDDDDDKKSRNINVPECVTGGKNYLRCDPATVKSSDKDTCNAIKHDVCGKDMSNVDKSYCECIGLYGKGTANLRGIMKVSL
ncbi:hypothetical protein HJC23_008490 [Cyclotella cryptica]|uniref:Uncharacterized protein n=1 Tax=Cyclotella cryptica TaxID=29204 RepID=A0ABD3R4E4_9STRA|eukprot:CCRYP_001236-RA/>CCRYP_001236-RA protein AED:0.14 eAED:0.14 QI:131/0.77/0.6/1/0.88/0.8/10/572/478